VRCSACVAVNRQAIVRVNRLKAADGGVGHMALVEPLGGPSITSIHFGPSVLEMRSITHGYDASRRAISAVAYACSSLSTYACVRSVTLTRLGNRPRASRFFLCSDEIVIPKRGSSAGGINLLFVVIVSLPICVRMEQ
jgi:hypothetical protein